MKRRRIRTGRLFHLRDKRCESDYLMPPVQPVRKVMIFQSELDYLLRQTLKSPDIETGGQLFGVLTAAGNVLIMYVIGPGPSAERRAEFFRQDRNYLITCGKTIHECGLIKHVGEWHSHHQMELDKPSRHDSRTMTGVISHLNLGSFLLCICNIKGEGVSAHPFIFDSYGYHACEWDVIPSGSPVRYTLDRALSGCGSCEKDYGGLQYDD